MKNFQLIISTLLLFIFTSSGFTGISENTLKKSNTILLDESSIIISGKVVDSKTNKPIVFASVTATGTNIGTVTNTEGEFNIQFDKSLNVKSLSFKYIGYQNKEVEISSIPDKKFKVKLKPSVVPIEEVIIRPNNPKELIREILRKIPVNYSDKANKEMAFYREFVKNKRKYVSISEAVVEVYKAPYNK